MRIDKIRKQNNNNVIDLDIARFDVKFDHYNYPIEHPIWFIKTEQIKANINIRKLINNKDQIQLMKEFRHFIRIQKMSVSEATCVTYFNIFKVFMDFANSNNIKIKRFLDINYRIIEKYVEHIKSSKGAAAKYRDLKNILKKVSQTQGIFVHEDIRNNNYVQIKLNKNNTLITHYTEEDFKAFAKTIISIMEDYLGNKGLITESCFVMSSYWFISICTGFNKTGIDSLSTSSFEFFDEHKRVLTIIGEKNRSIKGYQIANLIFNDEKNNLLGKVINKLIELNKINSAKALSPSLFIHKVENIDRYYIYNGSTYTLIKNKIYKEYATLNNCSVLPSTAKIRNYRSLFLYDKSKNEKIVADIMNHRSIKTTIEHYIKQTIKAEDNIGIFLVQNLLTAFANNESFEDWIKFQSHFDLKKTEKSIIIKNISDGVYNSPLGSCIKDTNIKEPCTSYINCFKCKHYSVISDRDLWKILSFRECLMDFTSSNNKDYNWLLQSINKLLLNFDKSEIGKAKKQLKISRHPFWKNDIMLKQIINDYEVSV